MASISLRLKSKLVGSPLEAVAIGIKAIAGSLAYLTDPNMSEVHLESRRLPLILRRLLTANSNCVDVGAHIGSFTREILRIAPRGKHIAIEAVPHKAAMLRKKFATVQVFDCAVGEKDGSVRFEENIDEPGYSRISNDQQRAGKIISYSVPLRRLDDILVGPIDFIKLDIEGAEFSAIRGAASTINKYKPALLFECVGDDDLRQMGYCRRSLFEFLTHELKYEVFLFGDFLFDKGALTEAEFAKSGKYPFRAFNYLALPRGYIPIIQPWEEYEPWPWHHPCENATPVVMRRKSADGSWEYRPMTKDEAREPGDREAW